MNPFQRHIRRQDHLLLSGAVFEAPIPLSAADGMEDGLSSCHGVFHFSLPSLNVVALEGAPITTQLPSRRWISLLYVADGEVCVHQQNLQLTCSAGDCLFIPEGPILWQSSTYSVVCLMFSSQQLHDALSAIKPQDLTWKTTKDWDFSRPACRKMRDGDVEASLLTTLSHLLTITSELATTHPILLTRLGVTNQLCLLTGLLACSILTESPTTEKKELKFGGVAESLEDVTEYILAHLSEPLNLATLEKYSHYSRRSLQYAFREKFGCTITQWIRAQRLDRAYQRLNDAAAGETVKHIANECGYRSVSLFSIEFQNRFHVKPSVLLRENS